MASWSTCVFVLISMQIALISSEKANVCEGISPVRLNLTGKRRWYYCKTSSSGSDNGCYIDVNPLQDGSQILTRTRYNKDTKKLEAKSFTLNATLANTVRKRVSHVDVALTADQNCMLILKCWKETQPFVLFACRSKEGCSSDIHQDFLDKELDKLKTKDVKTDLKKYYDEKLCGE